MEDRALVVLHGSQAFRDLASIYLEGKPVPGSRLREIDPAMAFPIKDEEVFQITDRTDVNGAVAFHLRCVGLMGAWTPSSGLAGVENGTEAAEQFEALDDTLSDAAFLDECAMRVIAQLVNDDSESSFRSRCEIAYDYATEMRAERKRRREGA